MYNADWPSIDATCHITHHANPKDGTNRNRQKAEGVYPVVFTLRWGDFLWIVGLLVAATMIAASGEA